MKKKNMRIKIAIVILCLLVLGLAGYIVYNKVLNNNSNQVRYYQYYNESTVDGESVPLYNSREIELNNDNTARWYFGGNASGGDEYKGTYIETSDKITLTLSRNMPNGVVCDDNQSVFPCSTTLILNKVNDDTLVSVAELGNDGNSYTYTKTTKDTLKYIS